MISVRLSPGCVLSITVSAERQLDAAPMDCTRAETRNRSREFALVLVERLDLAALRIDDARVVRDERARRVSGQCATPARRR
jgi:hypothetical protein